MSLRLSIVQGLDINGETSKGSVAVVVSSPKVMVASAMIFGAQAAYARSFKNSWLESHAPQQILKARV